NHGMFAAPFLEASIGVALLARRFRPAALVAAIVMHIFVLWAIGPWGNNYNPVVWPWNLAMIAFLTILFRRTKSAPADIVWTRNFAFQRIVLLLFAIAPALSFFNLWDAYLSFAFYAGNENSASISMTDAVYDRLPEALDDYVYEDGPDLNDLSISDWSPDELKVPPYAEIRVFRNVGR